uniref:Glycine N-acyltransferase-like protein 3 n=1 Tax=Lygus hesperus TaxID=30085 RepID=A0A0A9WW50_LYGHE
MEQEDALREIPAEDFQPLLDDLKSDFPNSIHAWSFLKSIERWRADDPTLSVKILAINGDYRRKFIVFYTAPPNLTDLKGSIHKWSNRIDDDEIIREALKNSKHQLPWICKGLCLLSAVTEETDRAVIPFLREIWIDEDWSFQPGHLLYWVPKEDALHWKIEAPHGTYVSFLNEAHAKEVDRIWPHRYDGSLDLISSMIRVNFGMGLFDSETNELMAWALHWFYGAIGVLQTKDQHKKKGYAATVVKAISREIARRGDDVFLNIIPGNTPSINLVEKLGFKFLMNGTWIFKGF